ncbi:tyrosine-type recombinase/integrase [Kamptonema sp. PCC 6506]|uniref:tyrosine-type recombinase/integrase n=2 Tax=Kamptonema TaxID=1501433 RepID=UPI001F44C219|nr:tyrosine-type recombinase/integrase [Kamptonema sp. PCC 6506]
MTAFNDPKGETLVYPMLQQGNTIDNETLLDLWLHGRSKNTAGSYRLHTSRLLSFVDNKPLSSVTLADIQAWELTLSNLSSGSQRTAIFAIKSLLSFGHKLGVLPVNVGLLVRSRGVKDTLSERILSEAEVQAMIASETDPRNRVMLRLLYSGGLRVSELCGLKWKDLKERPGAGGQVTIFGKGNKTRVVLLPPGIWGGLIQLGPGQPDDPVFHSYLGGGHLHRSHLWRIVKAAAIRAGISDKVSPHWLRHAHASHSLDRGAPIHLVQQTLGHSSLATITRYLHAKPTDSSALYLPD